MDSQGQLFTFCLSVVVGFVGGIFYEIFAIFRLIFHFERKKNKFWDVSFDILYLVGYAMYCIFASFILHFPNFRVYMWLGFGLGGLIYSKTLRRIVAFLEKICYTKLRGIANKAKAKKKLSKSGDKNYDTR